MTKINKAIWFAVAGIAFSGTVALAQTGLDPSPRDRAPNVADEPEEGPTAWLGIRLSPFKSGGEANEGAAIF